jgi:hypothetical protein
MKITNINAMFGKYGSDDTRRFVTLDLESGKPGEIHAAHFQAKMGEMLFGPTPAPKFKRIAVAVAAAYQSRTK